MGKNQLSYEETYTVDTGVHTLVINTDCEVDEAHSIIRRAMRDRKGMNLHQLMGAIVTHFNEQDWDVEVAPLTDTIELD